MKRIFLLLFLICSFLIYPQEKIHKYIGELPFRHFSTKDGLAGSNVLSFLQDGNGFIWFATSTGLSRFDGKVFQNYTTANGLLSNNLTDITESEDSTIFISSYDRGINYIKNGRVYNYEINDEPVPVFYKLYSIGNSLISYADYFDVISNNRIKHIIHILDSPIKSKLEVANFFVYNIENVDNKKIFLVTSIGLLSANDFSEANIYKVEQKGFFRSLYKNGDSLIIGGNGTISSFDLKNSKKLNFHLNLNNKKIINNLLVDKYNNIWFSILNDGLYVFKNNKVYSLNEFTGLSKTNINFIKKDDENNIWVGTFGKGIYFFYNSNLTNYNYNDGLNSEFTQCIQRGPGSTLLFGTINGINLFDGTNFKTLYLNKQNAIDYIKDIIPYENKLIIVGSYGLPATTLNNKNPILNKQYDGIEYGYLNCASLTQIKGNKFLLGGWDNQIHEGLMNNNFLLYTRTITIFSKSFQKIRINKLLAVSETEFWVGTTIGLCHIVNNTKEYFTNDKILSSNINDIKKDPEGNIWIAAENGVTYYKNGKWYIPESLKTNNILHSTSISFDNINNAWISSNTGIYSIKSNELLNYNSENGIHSNDINCAFYDKELNCLWLGTNEGISKLNLQGLPIKKHKIPLFINNISSLDETIVYNRENEITIPYEHNNLKVNFSAPYFKYPEKTIFQYKFENGDKNWNETSNNFIELASLSAGNYKLLVRAKNIYNNWSEAAIVNFTVKTPFTQSIIFYGLVILFFTFVAVGGTKKLILIKITKERKIRETENKILELRHQAIAAMMNPHFIFNSLNSIQNFINNHNIKDANLYLSKFAKLIRQNLDLTQNSFISLQEEFDRLKLYLSLEKMRFGNEFNYFIKIDHDLNPDEIFIPGMIIQPFVENAIWHGILPNKNKGNVIIYCKFDSKNQLLIQISDNGVGFGNKTKVDSASHISRGIKMIEERLKLLNDNKNEKLIEIVPLKNEKESGTLVTITLPPKIYHYDT